MALIFSEISAWNPLNLAAVSKLWCEMYGKGHEQKIIVSANLAQPHVHSISKKKLSLTL